MPKQTPEERIDSLEQRKAQILNKLARLRSVESTKARKLDTRRKILAGACVLAIAEKDQDAGRRLRKSLDEFLKLDRDRLLFGLTPRPKASAST